MAINHLQIMGWSIKYGPKEKKGLVQIFLDELDQKKYESIWSYRPRELAYPLFKVLLSQWFSLRWDAVGGRNPANQLRLVVYPIL